LHTFSAQDGERSAAANAAATREWAASRRIQPTSALAAPSVTLVCHRSHDFVVGCPSATDAS
jgi:hypothetical protein